VNTVIPSEVEESHGEILRQLNGILSTSLRMTGAITETSSAR
jgi:hypothetical protein